LSRAQHATSEAEAGFTIIEALVALTLVATMLAAIGSLVGSSVRGTRSLEQHTALVNIARDVAAGIPRRAEIGSVALTGDAFGNRWRIDTRPYLPESVAPAKNSPWVPHIVRIRVTSPNGNSFDLDTVRLLPAAPR
jgi:general secretion pathway protein I